MTQKRLLNYGEAAEYLSISKPTLYRMIKDGQIKPVLIRESRRVEVQELERYLSEQKRKCAAG